MTKKWILISSISLGALLIGGGVTTFVIVTSNKSDAPVVPPSEFSITLNHTLLTLKEGESQSLVATTSEPATITWSSLDESIATVTSEGLVYAVKEGETTVTATAKEKTASCTIKVSKDEEPPSFTITLNEERLDLKEGESFDLIATPSEPATITWSSNDTSVATVTQTGHVVAVKEGTTFITASANDVDAYCEIYVTKENAPIELKWGTIGLTNIDALNNGEEQGPYQLQLVTTSESSDTFTGRFSAYFTSNSTKEYKLIDYLFLRVYESTTKENAIIDINSSKEEKSDYVDIGMSGSETKNLYVYIGMDLVSPYIYNQLANDEVEIFFDWSPVL